MNADVIDFSATDPEATDEFVARMTRELRRFYRLQDDPTPGIEDGKVRYWVFSERDWPKVKRT